MADEGRVTLPDNVTTKHEAEPARGKLSRSKKPTAGKADSVSQKTAKPKARGLSGDEKREKINQVEAAIAGGATLKDAVNAVAISDQTYYTWKKAVAVMPAEESASRATFDDELAEFAELEEENRRLRKLLAEKLRAENTALRKRLGMN
jgi:putative transposase